MRAQALDLRRVHEKGRLGGMGPQRRGLPGASTRRDRFVCACHAAGMEPDKSFLSMRLQARAGLGELANRPEAGCLAAVSNSSTATAGGKRHQRKLAVGFQEDPHSASSWVMAEGSPHDGGSVPNSLELFRSLQQYNAVSTAIQSQHNTAAQTSGQGALCSFPAGACSAGWLHLHCREATHSVLSWGKEAFWPHSAGSVPAAVQAHTTFACTASQLQLLGSLLKQNSLSPQPSDDSFSFGGARPPPSGLLPAEKKPRLGMPLGVPQLAGRPPLIKLSCRCSSRRYVMARGKPQMVGRVPLRRLESRPRVDSWGKVPGVPHCRNKQQR